MIENMTSLTDIYCKQMTLPTTQLNNFAVKLYSTLLNTEILQGSVSTDLRQCGRL